MNEQQKYQKRNLLLFPLGTVGRDAVYALINSFLLTFVLFTRSLNAAQLTAITAIMVAARIFDALNDPIMGSIIEHTHSIQTCTVGASSACSASFIFCSASPIP